jgi:kumamolisin
MIGRHVPLLKCRRPAKRGATRLRDANPDASVEVTITLKGPEMPDADHVPGSSLSPQEFERRYGASQADADAVARVLGSFGLKTDEVSLETRSMRMSGTVAQMEAAFQGKMGIYHSDDQGEYRGREGDVSIPAELDGIVTGVFGLDQRRVARRRPVSPRSPSMAGGPTAAAASLAPLGPEDLETRYNFPPGDGEGQQIAIAEFGGGYFPNDLAAFCAKFHRPVPAVKVIPVNLNALTLQQIMHLPKTQRLQELGETGEVMMDIQVIAGLCPKAQISVYFATFDLKGWLDLLNRVIRDRPVVLSVSWGAPEDAEDVWSEAARDEINKRLAAAAALGITVCISAGDDGSGDEVGDGRAHVDFPAVSPFALSVGGTMLTGANGHLAEQVWWDSPGRRTGNGGGATGGGVSVFFQRPAWQAVHIDSLNSDSIDGRVIPDVAALAGEPLYDLVLLGHDAPNGGTSASAPLWAALIARINAILPASKRQRFLTPLLYEAGPGGQARGKTVCRDITVGQNASNPEPGVGYEAGTGFDAASGWGTPNGAALLAALQS